MTRSMTHRRHCVPALDTSIWWPQDGGDGEHNRIPKQREDTKTSSTHSFAKRARREAHVVRVIERTESVFATTHAEWSLDLNECRRAENSSSQTVNL